MDPRFEERLNQALRAYERDDLGTAIAHLRAALKQADPNAHPLARRWAQLGSWEEDLEQYEAAASSFRRALQALPSKRIERLSHQGLGRVLRALDDLEGAQDHLEQAVAIEPTVSGHVQLGAVCWQRGELDAAQTSFEKALVLDPEEVEALYNLGIVHREQGQHDQAIACLQHAYEREPESAPVVRELGFTLRAAGRLTEALPLLSKAAELRPTDGWAFVELGECLEATDDLTGARSCYRRAAELDGTWSLPHVLLGHHLRVLGRLGEARTHYEHALELAADDIGALRGLGETLVAQGERTAGRDRLRQALSIDPSPEQERRILERLAELDRSS